MLAEKLGHEIENDDAESSKTATFELINKGELDVEGCDSDPLTEE